MLDRGLLPALVTPARLITIPLSHYCEKVRWALDRVDLPYREEPHAPLLHLLATKRNGGGSVPVLVHGSSCFADSTHILVHADAVCGGDLLYPCDAVLRREVDEFEQRFDTELGPHVRRWAYAQLLPEARLLRSVWSRGLPWHEAAVLPMIIPLVRGLVRSVYQITPESANYSLGRVRDIFRQVDEHLGDGRRFLVGERFTAADLTFAALAAPALLPVECRAMLPGFDAVTPAMLQVVLSLRDTDAGRFALRLFSQERSCSSTSVIDRYAAAHPSECR